MARFNVTGDFNDLEKAKNLLFKKGFSTSRIYHHNDGTKRFIAAYTDTKLLFFVSDENNTPTYTLEEFENININKIIT